MTTPEPKREDGVLVLTVGTGDRDDPERTLFAPLRKSIAEAGCGRVVLLPSSVTAEHTNEFVRHPATPNDIEMTIRPLPPEAEFDADRAYEHVDKVLGELLRGAPPDSVRVDFTRGTKAMSAAAVLAAARREVPNLVYIDTESGRDRRGVVRPGSEVVRRVSTAVVDRHRRLDLARGLMSRGNFAATEDLLRGEGPPCDAVRSAARFYAAWDRLNYRQAADCDVPDAPSERWRPSWPAADMHSWVADLARNVGPDDHKCRAHRLRLVIVDLLANGERRLRQGQYEDAYVRAYRVLELIGQARLFDYGLDSSNLDPEHEAVERLDRKLRKKKSTPLTRRRDTLLASRLQVSRLLKILGDPLQAALLKYDGARASKDAHRGKPLLDPNVRNNSILIHGFAAKAPTDPGRLRHVLKELAGLARKDAAHSSAPPGLFDRRLRIARSMPPGRP